MPTHFTFDKFIDDLEERVNENSEKQKTLEKDGKDLPQREYNRLYRERWQNRIKFTQVNK